MPSGPRIRANNVFGTTTDNPLTAGAVTFNSAGLANLPVVSSAHAVVVLDPKRVHGEPEIVVVTAHTAAATVATIVRGQYGTVARSHPQGTAWAHVPVDEDYIEILTSGTRPSNPYEGQFIFETDTNKLVGYGGVDWASRDAGGQLAYNQASTVNQNYTTPAVAVTGTTATGIVIPTGRRIRLWGYVSWSPATNGNVLDLTIRQDGATVKLIQSLGSVAGGSYPIHIVHILTPSAGAHTYELMVDRSAGAGTETILNSANRAAWLLVEDIGAA